MKKINPSDIKTRFSFRRPVWMMMGMLVLIMGIIAAGGWVYFKGQRDAARHSAQEVLTSIADIKSAQISNWMKERNADAEMSLNQPLIRQLLDKPGNPGNREALLQWLNTLQQVYDYGAVILFDHHGKILLSAPANAPKVEPCVAELAMNAMRTQKIVFHDLHRSLPGKPVHMAILIPVRSKQIRETTSPNQADGVLTFMIDPNRFFYPLVKNWPVPSRTSESFLVRREGHEVVYLNDLRHRPNTALNLRFPLDVNARLTSVRAVLGQEGMVEGVDYRGIPVLSALSRINGTPWYLVVKQDLEEIYSPLRQQLISFVLITALLLFVIMLGIILVGHQQKLIFMQQELLRRKKAEETLSESEEKYRNLIAKMMNAFGLHEMIFDENGEPADYRFLEVNPAWEKTVGLKAESVIGKRIREIMPNIEDRWIRLYGRVVKTGVPEEFEDYNASTSKYYQVYAYCPSPGRFAVFFNDITSRKEAEETLRNNFDHAERSRKAMLSAYEDLKRAEDALRTLNKELDLRIRERTAQLEASNKELEAFSYSVSHDLRTPLRAINGFGQILTEDYSSMLDPEGQRLLGVISSETRRMGHLIDDLLSFSRLGRQEMESGKIEMTELVENVFKELAGLSPERIIQFECKKLPPARGDIAMIRVALTNLISNAIKFTHPRNPAVIEIGGIVENGETIYYVKDNGVGFDMKYAEKLFGVFQRLHSGEVFEGTGVGLSLVQRIIHRHGGRIWAESKVNEGATFFFTLKK